MDYPQASNLESLGNFVERSSRTLRQHRAVLSARQGDPEAPASGTFYAHRQRLAAELSRSMVEFGLATAETLPAEGQLATKLPNTRHSRSPAVIEEDLRVVDGEIASLQEQIDEIDRQLGGGRRQSQN
jgi:hypothetical protein